MNTNLSGKKSCSICGNAADNHFLVAREMMFGRRENFEYFECSKCGCLEITQIPSNIETYYPTDYYPAEQALAKQSKLKLLFQHLRAKYCLKGGNIIGRVLTMIFGRPVAGIFGKPDYYVWLKKCRVEFTSRIADVGCGSGVLLHRMRIDGFSNLTGIDPFIPASVTGYPGLQILKKQIHDVDDRFDLIMLHHTFEHMPEPLAVLKHLYHILNRNSFLLIRIPIASSYAYRKYGVNWVQLDAPRHVFLHTVKSMDILAARAGFEVSEVVFDSTEFQFWGSEQYVRDIPLKDSRSYGVNHASGQFTEADIAGFKDAAAKLNKTNDGDSACFYLYKA